MASSLRRTVFQIVGKRKLLLPTTSVRENSTEANILESAYSDVEIPNLTINDYVWQNLDRWPDKTLAVCAATGHGYTYAQSHRMSMTFAASLRTKLKVKNDDHIAVLLPNVPEYPCTVLGILEAGCIPALLNPIYTADELKLQFELTGCKAVVASKVSYPNIAKAISELKADIPVILIDNDQLPEKTIKFAEFAEDFAIDTSCLKSIHRTPKDTAFLPFSSGTSGFPKGVVLNHRSVVAMNQQVLHPSLVSIDETTATYQTALPAVLPFYHIFGLNVILINGMTSGVKFVTLPSFKPELFLETIAKHKAEHLHVVPPMVLFLGKHPAVTPAHIASLRHIIAGAAPMSAQDIEAVVNKNKEINFRQGYGLTETNSAISVRKVYDDVATYDAVGQVLSRAQVKIVCPEKNEAVGVGQEGEIWYRGPNVMTGYYKNEKANKEVFTEDGWLKTGDIGKYDENKYLYVTDRIKELIKVKAFQVAPAELETVLRTHPKVMDVAVLGVPDDISGEVPKAFVVAQPGLTSEEILEYVNSKVVSFKKVQSVQFIEAIPKSPAGKILRRVIKEKYC